MNAARRAIVSDLKHHGLTPKQAYDETKRKSFIKRWKRAQLVNGMLTVFDGRPKHSKPSQSLIWFTTKWIKDFVANTTKRLFQSEEKQKKELELGQKRKRFIAKALNSGYTIDKAIELWEKAEK